MEKFLKLLPSEPPSLPVRYGITASLVGIFFLSWLGTGLAIEEWPIIFVPPVLAASIVFDRGSGLFATALSAFAIAWLRDWHGEPITTATGIGVFILVCILITLVGEGMRKALERAIGTQQELDLLLQEQGHRIKNDLAMAAAVIAMQAKAYPDQATRSALESAVGRLHVLAESHEHLRVTTGDQVVDMQEYLTDLCWKLGETLRGVRPIDVRVHAESVVTKIQKATRIGLIVNELVTNALKHAFPGEREGVIAVTLRRMPSELVLTIADNGVGCSQEPDLSPGSGLGSRLVRLLVQQLGGTMLREDARPGCRYTIRIPPPPS